MNEEIGKQVLAELQGLNVEIQDLKVEIQNLKNEQQVTNDRLRNIELKQQLIHEQTANLTEFRTETIASFEQLATKEDLNYFDLKISQHERDIFKIQHRN